MSIKNQDYSYVDDIKESEASSSSPFRSIKNVEKKKISIYDVEWRETGSGQTALHVAAK